jgi:hypothetical protein
VIANNIGSKGLRLDREPGIATMGDLKNAVRGNKLVDFEFYAIWTKQENNSKGNDDPTLLLFPFRRAFHSGFGEKKREQWVCNRCRNRPFSSSSFM